MSIRSVRQKILVAFGGAYLGAVILLYFVSQGVLLDGFQHIERDLATNGVRRVRDALVDELDVLNATCGDWAGWDDTRDFILGENPDFLEENLSPQSLATINLNFMTLYTTERTPLLLTSIDIDQAAPADPPPDLASTLAATEILFQHASPSEGKVGLIRLSSGVALVASRPVTNNDQELPIHGTLVLGRYLSATQVANLSARTHQELRLWDLGAPEAIGTVAALGTAGLEDGNIGVLEHGSDVMAGYMELKDIQGAPLLLLEVDFPRTVLHQGIVTTRIFSGILLGAGAVALLALLFATERVVLHPVAVLARHVRYIQEHKDLGSRLEPRSQDEVGTLTNDFNDMVSTLQQAQDELEEVHQRLLETARAAGMAEVASGVLHNVGNVMNSVNITASTLRKHLRESKVANLGKAAEMLGAHQGDLAAFLTADEKGRRLPDYLAGLAGHLSEERDEALNTCDQLMSHIRHTIEIIGLQQSYARNVALVETIRLADVIQDAVDINAVALGRHRVEMEQRLEPLPPMPADRHRVLQILVNLISNAKYAVSASENAERRITISLAKYGEDRVRIEVADTGKGIAAEELTKIFSYGFTTREDGHGFGLHTAALTAQQLGGTLEAFSDGPGRGATFRLDLPLDSKGKSA